MKITDKISITNEDNMELMARYPDNYFDLAIVDPPYGMPKDATHGRGKLKNRILNTGGVDGWDIAPSKKYFDELFRVSKNQIIWGGNYFDLKGTRGFVVWDKEQPFENFSSAEYAWTSFQTVSKIIRIPATRTGDEVKIHPTQKPIKLYKELINWYAKPGDKVLDTHLGSGSIAIACYDFGYELTACELDEDYYNDSIKRIKNHIANNQSLFAPEELLPKKLELFD